MTPPRALSDRAREDALHPWRDHLPTGADLAAGELVGGGDLLRAWSALWRRTECRCGRTRRHVWERRARRRAGGGRPRNSTRPPGGWPAGCRAPDWCPVTGCCGRPRRRFGPLVAHVGALRAGLVVVPANTAYTRREVAHIVTDVRPAAAIVERAPTQAEWVSGRRRRVGSGGRPGGGSSRRRPPTSWTPPHLMTPALICYTSGTTGTPRARCSAIGTCWPGPKRCGRPGGGAPTTGWSTAFPLFHAHGLCVGVYGTLSAGASAVLLPGFDPAAVADAVADRAGHVVLRGAHHVPPAGRSGTGR